MAEQRYGNRGRSSRSEESRPQTLQAKFNIDNPFAGAFEDIIIQRTNMTAGGFSYADSAQEISAYQAGNWKPATLDFNHTAGNGFVATSSITSFLHEIDTAADGSISTINLIGHGTTAGFIFSGARNAGNTDFGMNTGTSLSWSNLLRSGYINDDNRTSPLRSKFARDATMTFYACRSGNDDRFLQSIADFFGVTARGFVNPVYWCITYNSDTTTWSPRGHTAYPGPCGGAGQRGFSHLSPDLTRTPEV
jgi:hypothetical protein